jgi:hypothetical protein
MSSIRDRLIRALLPRLDRALRAEEMHVNPLAAGRYRNLACPCGSGAKVKRCCGKYPALPAKVAQAVRRALK